MKVFQKGDRVSWNWGGGEAEGVIQQVFEERVSRQIKGAEVTRNATPDSPALLIRQDDGDEVLKSESEVEHVTKTD